MNNTTRTICADIVTAMKDRFTELNIDYSLERDLEDFLFEKVSNDFGVLSISEMKDRISYLEDENNDYENDISNLKSEIDEADNQIKELEEKIDEMQDTIDELEETAGNLQMQLDGIDSEI